MAIRYCIGCNTRHPKNTMIPLSLDPGGSCVVGQGRRSAWVCECARCLKAVTDSPGPASRSFKARVRPHADLEAQVNDWRINRQKNALRTAYRSGLLVFSTGDDYDPSLNETIWVVTKDHPIDRHKPHINFDYIMPSMPTMAIHSETMAEITGRTGCTLLGIRSGRATQSLIDSLRRWQDVG